MEESEVSLGVGPQQSRGVELWVELQWTQGRKAGSGELELMAWGERKAGRSVEERGEGESIL